MTLKKIKKDLEEEFHILGGWSSIIISRADWEEYWNKKLKRKNYKKTARLQLKE